MDFSDYSAELPVKSSEQQHLVLSDPNSPGLFSVASIQNLYEHTAV